MEQGDYRLNAIFPAAADHTAVVLDFLFIERAVLRLDSGPLDAEPVGIQSSGLHQLNIIFIAVVMVAGNAALFFIGGVGHLFLCPAVGVRVEALYLMGSSCGTDKKAFWKFGHGEKLLSVSFLMGIVAQEKMAGKAK